MSCMAPWLLLVLGISAGAAEPEVKPAETAVRVDCIGKLRHGILAAGGETTGTTITFNGIEWELRLKDEASREFAKTHQKQTVSVTGTLRRFVGMARPVRWIVEAETLAVPDEKASDKTTVTVTGPLKSTESEASPFTIDAGGHRWPLLFRNDPNSQTNAKALVGLTMTARGAVELVNPADKSGPAIVVDTLKATKPKP